MMVGPHHRFAEPFALLTCSKCEQLFSKHNFTMHQKIWRTSSLCRSAKKHCHTKLPTGPPYQIKLPSTLIGVKGEVFVYEYIHNRILCPVCQYSLKKTCATIVLSMLVLCTQALAKITLSDAESHKYTVDVDVTALLNNIHMSHWSSCPTYYSSVPK
jgi:hypothetical protein